MKLIVAKENGGKGVVWFERAWKERFWGEESGSRERERELAGRFVLNLGVPRASLDARRAHQIPTIS